jgi:hypothetical protein
MEYYKNEIRETLADLVESSIGYETRDEILDRWERGEYENDFGEIDGSRFCSTYRAQEAIKASGFPFDDELNEALKDCGCNITDLLAEGAERLDIVLCEITLLCSDIINELREEGEEEEEGGEK